MSMSKGCEMCNRTGVVFKPGMPGLDDKDTCPECGGRGIVESATAPAGERDATADLAMLNKTCRACSGTGVLRSPVAEGECGNCDGTGIAYPDEDMVALAEYWIERAEHLEAENEEVRHELDRSRNAHGKAELELARFRTTLASIEEYGTEEINAAFGLRKEIDSLNVALSEANDTIERMSHNDGANALDRLRAWRDAAPGRWFNLENDIGCLEVLALGELPDAAHLPSRLSVIACNDEPHTEDNPASFAEMVAAVLARWAELYGEQ